MSDTEQTQVTLDANDYALILSALAAYRADAITFRNHAPDERHRQMWQETADKVVALYAKVEELL